MREAAAAIDGYLAHLPELSRVSLAHLRDLIGKAAPFATETISYAMPAFKHHGSLVGFAASKRHCSFFPMSVAVMAAFADDLAEYDTAKGTIRFTPDRPQPDDLVTRIVEARVAENEARAQRRGRPPSPADQDLH